jgi:methyltransferase (TIGR00027 family)
MPRGPVSTLEGAAFRRAAHAKFERPPIFDDSGAIALLGRWNRFKLRVPPLYWWLDGARHDFSGLISASAWASFRRTDELVESAVAWGVDQYLILSAGLDSFGIRRRDLCPPLRVFELDHPQPSALKRRRIRRAVGTWPESLELVPIDFETTSIPIALQPSSFDPKRPAVASWLNSIPYLTESATIASLEGLAAVLAPGSRLIFNYPPAVPLDAEQRRLIEHLRASVSRSGEPFRAVYDPAKMIAITEGCGFSVEEHRTERDLAERYFQGRKTGPRPILPARLIIARRD